MNMIEVTITVVRNGASKTYQLQEAGASRKGTYLTFAPVVETPDLPGFGKVYIKADRDKVKPEKPIKEVKAT